MTPDETGSEGNGGRGFPAYVVDRVAGAVLLVLLCPMLLVHGFVLCVNTREPVLLVDELLTKEGRKLRVHRFRTTGEGNEAFHWFGRHLRQFSLDDWPALFDVVCGGLSIKEFFYLIYKR